MGLIVTHTRRLPHLHKTNQPIFLTWRLHGSLPPNRHFPTSPRDSGKAFAAFDRLLDTAITGPLYLKQPALANLITDAIQYRHNTGDYELHAYTVMANHVHLLVTPKLGLAKILHSLKRFTAKAANDHLGRTGQPFWQDETYDHLVRSPQEFNRIARYIEWNPVKAGLVEHPTQFPYSSATLPKLPPRP